MNVIDETDLDLKNLIERDFGSSHSKADFKKAFIDWLYFQARTIPQRKRKVLFSDEIKNLRAQYPAIDLVKARFVVGLDLKPWQSDTVRKKIADPLADLMFSDWQIMHFHMGHNFVAPDKVRRTGPLLFVFISPDKAVFLDVQQHGAWTRQALLQILLKTSPDSMVEVRGILPSGHSKTDEDYASYRNMHITQLVEINGKTYVAPGYGLATSGHGVRFVMFAIAFQKQKTDLLRKIKEDRFPTDNRKNEISVLKRIRLGLILNAGQLIFIDKNTGLPLAGSQLLA